MGTFVGYYGDGAIHEAKLDEYIQRAKTVLDVGGMMSVEPVEMMGKRIALLAPPKPCTFPGEEENSHLSFWYNYFERDAWEAHSLDLKTGECAGGKVGYSIFHDVALAIDVLNEFYSKVPGLADDNGRVTDASHIISWLNYLFDASWGNQRVLRLLKLCAWDDEWSFRKKDEIGAFLAENAGKPLNVLETVRSIIARGDMRTVYGIARVAFNSEIQAKHLSVLRCILHLENSLSRTHKEGVSKEIVFDVLAGKAKAEDKTALGYVAAFGRWLPPDITSAVFSDVYRLDYDTVYAELSKYSPDKATIDECEEYITHHGKEKPRSPEYKRALDTLMHQPLDFDDDDLFIMASKFGKMSTEEFLSAVLFPRNYEFTGDDRAYWWRPDGDVRFSSDMEGWLDSLGKELEALTTGEGLPKGSEVLPRMFNTLSAAQEEFRQPFFFAAAFYEFIIRAEDPKVQAAVVLLERVYERCKDAKNCTELMRYCSVLGNQALREKVWGF